MPTLPKPLGQPYTYSSWDGGLDALSSRCRVDASAIYGASAAHDAKWKAMTQFEFGQALKTGDNIWVPLPLEERGWQFEIIAANEGESLAAVCARMNADKRRNGMFTLTPAYVWLSVMNAKFRFAHLQKNPTRTAELDADPTKVRALKGAPSLLYPLPIPDDNGHIAIKPLDTKKLAPPPKAFVATPPDWVNTLTNALRRLREDTATLQGLELSLIHI